MFPIVELLNQQQTNCFYRFTPFPILEIGSFKPHLAETRVENLVLPEHFLLVSVRKGLSFFVVSQGKIEKDHGSIIGEKTILAILKLKFPAIPIPQLIRLAFTEGTIKDTDLLVSDIYGASTGSLGLPKNLLASSMGKIGKLSKV